MKHWIGFDARRGIIFTGLKGNHVLQVLEKKDIKNNTTVYEMLLRLGIKRVQIKGQFWKKLDTHNNSEKRVPEA